MHVLTDEEIVRAVQSGEVSRYADLVRRYEKPLVSFAARITGNHADAEEAVQDALVSIYRTIDRVDVTKRFSTYIFTAVKNASISALRSRKQEYPLFEDDAVEDDMALYDALFREEAAQSVRGAVAGLPPHQRSAVELYYFGDLPYDAIAKRLGIPVNTVRTHLRRAKQALKEVLSQ